MCKTRSVARTLLGVCFITMGLSAVTRPGQAEDVIITEIMYHPSSQKEEEEYIELYNRGATPVSLGGWKITAGVDFTFPNRTLGSHEYLVVAANVTSFTAKYPTVTNVVGGWVGRLRDKGEEIELRNALGSVVNRVRYADEGDWSFREQGPLDHGHRGWVWNDAHDGGGKSLELIHLALPNEYGQNWAASQTDQGTPGTINSAAQSHIAPMIVDVNRTPVIPHSGQPTTVTARLVAEPPAGVLATLYHRVDGAPSFSALPMLDDGLHGDGGPGDGVFAAMLPSRPNGTIVEYYIEARDAVSSRTFPSAALVGGVPRQVTNLLYLVNDSAATTATMAWVPGSLPIYYFIMTEAERAELADIGNGGPNTDQESDAQMNGTFISIDPEGVEACYNVGLRNRGHGTRLGPPNNYRVNFVHDHPWKGVTAIEVNSRYPYLQLSSCKLFQLAGLHTPDAEAVRVRVNGRDLAETGSRMYDSYVRIETTDSDFAAHQYPTEANGNVYRCMRMVTPGANLSYLGPDPTPYRVNYFKETNEGEDDWSDLIGLTYALSPNTADSVYVSEVNRTLNVDQWMRFMAVNTLLANMETTLANGDGDDYYLFFGENDRQAYLIQHDLDTVFGMGDTPVGTNTDIRLMMDIPVLDRLMRNPAFAGLYYHHLVDLMNTIFSPQQMDPLLDGLLGRYIPASRINAMKSFIAARNAYVLSQIPTSFTIHSDLPLSGGYHRSTVNVAALYGTANAAETQSVMVNGQPARWSPFDGTWSIGSGSSGTAQVLLPRGSRWRYYDHGIDLGTAWRPAAFNDTSWSSGPARLGFGGDGEITPINGGPAGNRYMTTYFRTPFALTNPSSFTQLRIQITRDDGALVWLNGHEAARTNLPQGDVLYPTAALTNVSPPDETRWYEYTTGTSMLQSGTNVLAVEVHQSNLNSSDLGLDLELGGVSGSGEATSGVLLLPGINRLIVQAFDGPNGTGKEVNRGYIDIWYDNGSVGTGLSGTISTMTLTLAGSPWHVTGDLIVPVGVTLTVEPGVTVFFDPATHLIVRGRLVCEGTDLSRIHMSPTPGGGANWSGIRFENTHAANRITFTAEDYAVGETQAILVDNSQLLLDNLTWTDSDKTVLELSNSNLLVRRCVFPNVSNVEIVHGVDLPPNGYLIFDGNTFGRTTGYCDVIDFTGCKRPNAIFQVLNNVFLGGSDDGLDLDGTDAHIEGNIFEHFHQDAVRPSSSNAVATGTYGGNVAVITVCRNIFYHNDHDVLIKEGSSMTAQNNTFIGATSSSINFDERNRNVPYGYGARLEGNIFRNMAKLFENQYSQTSDPNPIIRISQSDVPTTYCSYGAGNIDLDPRFTNPAALNFSLLPGSPCIQTGPNGLDMGALVPAGASISGEPPAVTSRTEATLIINGPGIIAYKYAVNGGAYGPETPIWKPLHLTGLTSGSYTVFVLGKSSAAVWQATPARSKSWTVRSDGGGPAGQPLKVTEVMYNPPAGSDYEFIELRNASATAAVNLTSMTFTNGIRYTFPAGSVLGPNGYGLVVRGPIAGDFADFRTHYGLGPTVPIFGPYSGKLANAGERVTLATSQGIPVISFQYRDARGWPLPAAGAGHSLVPLDTDIQTSGSLDYGGNWRFSTFLNGSPGGPDPVLPPTVVLNEVAAHTHFSDPRYPGYDSNDWIELYNPTSSPVNLSGWYLSDDPAVLQKWAIPTTATVPAHGRLSFDEITGFHNPLISGFGLSEAGEQVLLSYLPGIPASRVVDAVGFKGQEYGVSLGRSPDGAPWWYATTLSRNVRNTSPIADVVINEFMFNPPLSQAFEYIKLHNPTNHTINLFNAQGPWRIAGGSDFTFPPGLSLPAGDYLLVVKFDPTSTTALAAFKSAYGLAAIGGQIAGPTSGSLANHGERIALERPQAPQIVTDPINWVIVDEVIYFDQAPWTDQANGTGFSLHRVAASRSGNDPTNWVAGSPTPGIGTVGAPSLAPEPPFTSTTANTLYWTPPSGSVACLLQWSASTSFATIAGTSGWTAATQYRATGLTDGVRYYYRAKARDAGLVEGPWSNVVNSQQDATPPTVPGVPTDIGMYSSSTAVRFAWTAATDSGSGVAIYGLNVGTTPGAWNVFNGFVSSTAKTVNGQHGQTLYARVYARDAVGNGSRWSNVSDGITIDTVRPRLTSAVSNGTRTLTVTFDEPVGGADLASSYLCSGGVIVTSVLRLSGSLYRLTTTAQTVGGAYTLTVKNPVKDLAGNAMDPNYSSKPFRGGGWTGTRAWQRYR